MDSAEGAYSALAGFKGPLCGTEGREGRMEGEGTSTRRDGRKENMG